jgi:ATP-dependent protease ClpP protease subunit
MCIYRKVSIAIMAWTALGIFPSVALADLSYDMFQTENSVILKASGTIAPTEDPQKLVDAISRHKPTAIMFDSPGGNPNAAMQLGRIIRASGIMTWQLRAFQCESACAFAFLGGTQRFAEPGSIGVHRNSFTDDYSGDSQQAASDIQQLTADLIMYFKEMGVDPAILSVAYRYDRDDIRYLSGREMADLGVTTQDQPVAETIPQVDQVATTPSPTQTQDRLVKSAIDVSIPIVNSVVVRHPKGSIAVLSEPREDATPVFEALNGSIFPVLFGNGKWFKIRMDAQYGYVHKTWVYPEEFDLPVSDLRFIQISSFPDFESAKSFADGFGLVSEVYFTSDNWFAVTIGGRASDGPAKQRLAQLKANGLVPEDSFVTFGNTYIRKVCCE